jgi:iron complex transport system ATP-binding protein
MNKQSANTCLDGHELVLRYEPRREPVIDHESIFIPPGKVTALVGANGSGKSTLLKALAHQLAPESGHVILDGRDMATMRPRELACKLGILFQEHIAPGTLTVEELVRHGRHPRRKMFESLTAEDHAAVDEALRLADLVDLRHRLLGEMSGGQRQLAWIAMAIAQAPDYLLLDEPTTFLDMAHQFDVMELIHRLNRDLGKTIVLVVHDLNIAARYADHVIALRDGKIVTSGAPEEVMTAATLRAVFDVEAQILRDEVRDTLFCLPTGRVRAVDR